MKLVIPEISWHNRDPVLSVHFQPIANDGFYRLATGGSDSHVFVNNYIFCNCIFDCIDYYLNVHNNILDMANQSRWFECDC